MQERQLASWHPLLLILSLVSLLLAPRGQVSVQILIAQPIHLLHIAPDTPSSGLLEGVLVVLVRMAPFHHASQ